MPIASSPLARTLPFPGPWFSEFTPKILVVTDGLSFLADDNFGLSEFVITLRGSIIHGMSPEVITARFNPDPLATISRKTDSQHIDAFKFSDPVHGLNRTRYDVVFIMALNRTDSPKLSDEAGALDAITIFMQAGGGLFATGDHEDLGAAMCQEIPRVRTMRYWTNNTPSVGGTDRLTTNQSGRGNVVVGIDIAECNDQSNPIPQRLYVNYRTQTGGIGKAHPLLQLPASNRAIEVFPDHPHEGECIIPSNLSSKLADGVNPEWPLTNGSQLLPEMVALAMSHGNIFPGKEAVIPRAFIAICAYDGQKANVGRVVTDSTWHHFVNIDIKPGMCRLEGRDLEDIKQYCVNLASWLMPKQLRLCRRFPWIIAELVRYPLFEEMPSLPQPRLDGPKLRAIGALVEGALLGHHTYSEVKTLIDDALEEALGEDAKLKLEEHGREIGSVSAHDVGLAALGSLTMAIAERFEQLKDEIDLNAEAAFADIAETATNQGAILYLSHARKNLDKMAELIDAITI